MTKFVAPLCFIFAGVLTQDLITDLRADQFSWSTVLGIACMLAAGLTATVEHAKRVQKRNVSAAEALNNGRLPTK